VLAPRRHARGSRHFWPNIVNNRQTRLGSGGANASGDNA
jgi:hypothetical protein